MNSSKSKRPKTYFSRFRDPLLIENKEPDETSSLLFQYSCNIRLHASDTADPGGSNLQRGFDLTILPDYLLIFPDFFPKVLHENEILLSQREVRPATD